MPGPRVLCLHGNGTSAVILEFQLMHLKRAIKMQSPDCGAIELVFADGGLEAEPAPGIAAFFPDQPYYKFCERTDDRAGYTRIEGAMQHVQTIMEAQGPFDGIIGFSQGANVACMYAAHLEAGSIPGPPLKFVISMSGSRSGWDKQLADLFKTPLSTPSLGLDPADPTFAKASQTDVCGLHGDVVHRRHTIGEKDQYKESGEELVKLFSAPKVLMHTDNHRPLPAKKAAALPLAQAMLDFINAKTAEA